MDLVNGTRLSAAQFTEHGSAPVSVDIRGVASATGGSGGGDNQPKTLYILILVSFYGFFLLLVLLGYLRTKKPLSSQDPFHLYVQREWLAPARAAAAFSATAACATAGLSSVATGEPARCPSASSSGSSASAASAASGQPLVVPEIRVEAPTGEEKLRPLCLAERRMGIAAV